MRASLVKFWFATSAMACIGSACGGSQSTDAPPATPPSVAYTSPNMVDGGAAATPAQIDQTASAVKPQTGGAESMAGTPPAVTKAPFGTADGKEVTLYTLTNTNGLVAKVMTYGAIVTEFHAPDKSGKTDDIVLGYEKLDDYIKNNPYFGATVGRIGNRIKNAQFQLEGKTYKLAANNGPNSLHGGKKGFDKAVWDATTSEGADGPSIKLTYVSKDGEEGFPGTVSATTTYTLTNKNELKVVMTATTDKTTIVNLVHHTYWNLGGQASGSILDEELKIDADKYTVIDATAVPTGVVKPVKGTPFDFTTPKPIGKDLKAVANKPLGYDHNWVVNGDPHKLREVARVKDPKTGRVLTLEADQPGVQFYAGIFLDGTIKGKGGAVYKQYDGFCLETQKVPNSINIPAWKNEVILKPGQTYSHTMVHRFTTE